MCPSTPVIGWLCQFVTLNGTFHWSVVPQYLFSIYIIQGAIITITLAILSQTTGVLIGVLLYFMRRSRVAVFRWLGNFYIWIFRGTPLILQIILCDEILADYGAYHGLEKIDFFPHIGFPLVYFALYVVAFIALALNEGAYMSEIVRAGIEAIDTGQLEAAKSLGMTYGQAMRRIVLPQAARVIVPPLGNEFSSMIKNTSLAEVIALAELFQVTLLIGARDFITTELLVVAAFWYLVLTTMWNIIQVFIERRLNVSVLDYVPYDRGSFWSRAFGFGRRGKGGVPEAVAGLSTDRR